MLISNGALYGGHFVDKPARVLYNFRDYFVGHFGLEWKKIALSVLKGLWRSFDDIRVTYSSLSDIHGKSNSNIILRLSRDSLIPNILQMCYDKAKGRCRQ